ncbi:MAG TPA: M56 family metallopeptidase [Parachlamydiaceae bacterium]|nr:M56 family metallopeptidase [Parachlamydiaceae bacterium]
MNTTYVVRCRFKFPIEGVNNGSFRLGSFEKYPCALIQGLGMDKVAFFILNVFINSFFAFFTVVFLIEGILFLFRVGQGRIAATLRMLPILKLPMDLFFYDFTKWSFSQGINPLNCEEGTRTLGITFGSPTWVFDLLFLPVNSGIQLTMSGGWTFTIADVIGYTINPFVLNVFVVLLMFITVWFLLRRLFSYYRCLTALDNLAKNSQPFDRKVRNSVLSSYLKKFGVQILTSPAVTGSPFVAGLISSVIYIPDSLSKNLSRKEYEAVLAHEIEHVRNKDGLVRLILDFIDNIFWWIPTKALFKRIEEGLEVGCDHHCGKYRVDSTHLASAVCKSAKHSIDTTLNVFAFHLTRHTTLKRVILLLQPKSTRFNKLHLTFTCLAVGIVFFGIFFGRFWTF